MRKKILHMNKGFLWLWLEIKINEKKNIVNIIKWISEKAKN